MSTRSTLEGLHRKSIAAQTAYTQALAKAWPVGQRVQFNLQRGQINPSRGVVVDHWADQVTIRMASIDAWGRDRITVKRVGASEMLTEPQE